VLTELKAYSSWRSAPTLPLTVGGRPETDLIQIRNIEGLDPVKASVGTSAYGSVDGASYVGSSVLSRNIVLTLHPNPNWDDWTYEALRRLIYSYFMPKMSTKLVFYSDDLDPVEITGIVEDVSVNQFSKDPEINVSIICPDPYFTSLDPKVVTGQTIQGAVGNPVTIDYKGSVESGINVKVTFVSGISPTQIKVQIGDPTIQYFISDASVDANLFYEMNSVPLKKYVQNVNIGSGVITSLLSKSHMEEGSEWPLLQPGENEFSVSTDSAGQDWELSYFERFGGL